MLKEAIEKIVDMARPELHEVEGRTFAVGPEGVEEVRPTLDCPGTLTLTSLDALIKMVKTEALLDKSNPVYITIPTHDRVETFFHPAQSFRNARLYPYVVKATDVPGWGDDVQMGFEEAMIALRTRFQESSDSEYALKLLSDITTGSKVTYNDNGVATSIVTQSGVALQSNQNIRPIVTLRPYRTFQEVEQPASQFLIRVSERGIKFVEADGGMWKLKARQTVKEHLEEALSAEIKNGLVVIAL